MIEVLRSAVLKAAIHRIQIIRLRTGPDQVHLESNWPDPCGLGRLAFSFPVPRDVGPLWVEQHFPGVETHEYSYDCGKLVSFVEYQKGTLVPRVSYQPSAPQSVLSDAAEQLTG